MAVDGENSIYYPPFWYGFTNTFIAILLLILTILVTIGIRWRDNYSGSTSYQIMFGISVFDIMQLIEHLISGIALMSEWDIPETLNYVCPRFGDVWRLDVAERVRYIPCGSSDDQPCISIRGTTAV
ncbi:hypothetical protein Aduo_007472 [Ancylostoma duodenale]